jgi:hypothetical protein
MALTTGTASALVQGSSRKQPAAKMAEIEIVRGVFWDGKALAPGDRVTLPIHEANHMVAIGKAKKSTPVPLVPAVDPILPEELVNERKRMGRKVKAQEVENGSD